MNSLEAYKILTVITSISVIFFAAATIYAYNRLVLIRKILSELTDIMECQSQAIHLLARGIEEVE